MTLDCRLLARLALVVALSGCAPKPSATSVALRAVDGLVATDSAVARVTQGALVVFVGANTLQSCGDLYYIVRQLGIGPESGAIVLVTDEEVSRARFSLGDHPLPIHIVAVEQSFAVDTAVFITGSSEGLRAVPVEMRALRRDPVGVLVRLRAWRAHEGDKAFTS